MCCVSQVADEAGQQHKLHPSSPDGLGEMKLAAKMGGSSGSLVSQARKESGVGKSMMKGAASPLPVIGTPKTPSRTKVRRQRILR